MDLFVPVPETEIQEERGGPAGTLGLLQRALLGEPGLEDGAEELKAVKWGTP